MIELGQPLKDSLRYPFWDLLRSSLRESRECLISISLKEPLWYPFEDSLIQILMDSLRELDD